MEKPRRTMLTSMLKKSSWPWVLLLALTALGAWSCNLSGEGGEDTLTMRLSDSLQKYDSILIILKSGGAATDSFMVRPPYGKVENGRFKTVLKLDGKPPVSFTVEFTVFKGGLAAGQYRMDVTSAGATTPVRIDSGTGGKPTPRKVNILTLAPLIMVEHGQARSVDAAVAPPEADQGLLWKSLNDTVAKVDAQGLVTPGGTGETDIIATSKIDPTLSASLRVRVVPAELVEGISLSPTSFALYQGGEDRQITATFLPTGTVAVAVFTSDDTSVAVVSTDGRVHPKKKGPATISASPEGFPALRAHCTLTVMLDEPVLEVGDNRKVSPGEEVTFSIRVRQQYGGVAVLKWDLDGDGAFEGSTKDSAAAPKHTYDGKLPEVTVTFHAEDTEGNPVTVTRKVLVGGTAPVVDITRPGVRDTLVNLTPFTVEYLVDGAKKSSRVDLKSGRNPVEIKDSTAGGVGRDTVYITLDTAAPKVRITSPAQGLPTNKASIAVLWTVDSTVQNVRNTENLEGKQGPVSIIRDYTDSAGNRGADTVIVFRDTDPPAAPKFTAGTTVSPTRTRRPRWEWAGGGGGRGTFGYFLGSESAVEGAATSFTPTQDLADGDYTLSVYELDSADNKGLVSTRRIRVQTKGPRVAITSPQSGLVTRAASVAVAWTVNDVVQDSLKAENLAGKQGLIRILREATDSAGNRVADSVFITRDTIDPAAPAFTTQPPAMVNAAYVSPIQWVWTRTGPAADSFLVALNGGTAIRQMGTSYTLNGATNQLYFLEVREMDEGGNISLPVLDTVLVDRQHPPAPSVGGLTPTATPTWTWSRGANSDGASMFRYKYSTASAYSAETALTSFAPTNLASGSYTLQVQERDAAGNWSSDGSGTLVVDRTGPALSIASPSDFGRVVNFNPPVTGSVTDAQAVSKVEYRLNASAAYVAASLAGGNWNFTASYAAGANTVWIRAVDALGNRDSVQISIYKYPNVIFVRKGMTGTGKSWEDAIGELYQALDTNKANYAAGTEIWATVGKYVGNPAHDMRDIVIGQSDIKIMGGFSTTQPATDTIGRNLALNATIIANHFTIGRRSRSTLVLGDVVIDGFSLKSDPSDLPGTSPGVGSSISTTRRHGNLTLRNIKSDGDKEMAGSLYIQGNILILENSEFTNSNTFGNVVTLDGTATMRNCRFVTNWGDPTHFGFTHLTVHGSHFEKPYTGNGVNNGYHFYFESSSQSLSIHSSKVEGGQARIFRGSPAIGSFFYNSDNVSF